MATTCHMRPLSRRLYDKATEWQPSGSVFEELPFSNKGADSKKQLQAPVRAKSTGSQRGRGDSDSSVVPLPACAAAVSEDAGVPAYARRLPAQSQARNCPLPALDIAPESGMVSASYIHRSQSMPQLGRLDCVDAFAASTAKVHIKTAEAAIPASRLDLMDSSELSIKRSCTAPEMTNRSLEGYGVAFDATEWIDEALGELSATKFLEIRSTGTCTAVVNMQKKSKKAKHTLSSEMGSDEEGTCPRRSRRRPASTGSLRRGMKGRQQESCSLSCDDTLWHTRSKKTLQPLPKVQGASCTEQMISSFEPAAARAVEAQPRPSSAATSKQTIARIADANLWNIGFNDNDCQNDAFLWDCDKEIYCAWGGDVENWGDAFANSSDWGDDAADTLVF